MSEVTHQAPSISHRPEQSQNDFKRFYKYIYYKIWIEEKTVWRIPCGINVVGLSFFSSNSLLLPLLLFYSPSLTSCFWRTNAAPVIFPFFFSIHLLRKLKCIDVIASVLLVQSTEPPSGWEDLLRFTQSRASVFASLSSALESQAPPPLPNGVPYICFSIYRPGGDITPPVAKQSM